jgi:predicted HicB family RNase H-like nuclease
MNAEPTTMTKPRSNVTLNVRISTEERERLDAEAAQIGNGVSAGAVVKQALAHYWRTSRTTRRQPPKGRLHLPS